MASALVRLIAALLLGAALGALALRPSPLITFTTPRWLDTPGLIAAWGFRLDVVSLIAIAFGAAAVAARTGTTAGWLAAPLAALIGLALSGDATLLSLFWLIALFASHRPADAGGKTAGPLGLAYFGGFTLVAATLLGTAGASTLLQPRLAASAETISLLLAVLAVVAALPLLTACDEADGGVRPTILALACSLLLARSMLVWSASASSDLRLGAAALSLVGGLVVSRLNRTAGSSRSASLRLMSIEIGLIGAAFAIGGPGGIAAGVLLVLNLGLSAIPLVSAGDRPSSGTIIGLGALAGLPPLPGFVGRALLVGLCIERGYWGIAAGVALVSAVSLSAFATLAISLAGRADESREPDGERARDGAGTFLLALPLLAIGIVSAFGTTATLSALELAGLNSSTMQTVGPAAIAVLFVAAIAGSLWSGEEARQSDLRLRRDRLRGAALARERARRVGDALGDGATAGVDESPFAAFGERLAEVSGLAIAFQIAVLLLGLVVVAFQSGRI